MVNTQQLTTVLVLALLPLLRIHAKPLETEEESNLGWWLQTPETTTTPTDYPQFDPDLNNFKVNLQTNLNDLDWNKILEDQRASQKAADDLLKSIRDSDKLSDEKDKLFTNFDSNSYEYKVPEYTYTSYSRSGFNGYHASGGVFVIAIIIIFIRCCLICCRYSAQTPTRSVILVRETPVHTLIIARPRSNSKEDLMSNAEMPADDPPSYEDCTSNPPPPESVGGEQRPIVTMA